MNPPTTVMQVSFLPCPDSLAWRAFDLQFELYEEDDEDFDVPYFHGYYLVELGYYMSKHADGLKLDNDESLIWMTLAHWLEKRKNPTVINGKVGSFACVQDFFQSVIGPRPYWQSVVAQSPSLARFVALMRDPMPHAKPVDRETQKAYSK